jgi:hypothetical protein
MIEPIIDHEKLDVYRVSIECAAASYGIARTLTGVNRHFQDLWLRAARLMRNQIARANLSSAGACRC